MYKKDDIEVDFEGSSNTVKSELFSLCQKIVECVVFLVF